MVEYYHLALIKSTNQTGYRRERIYRSNKGHESGKKPKIIMISEEEE
jgi:hypothetical protein